jgi:hypothetical protein
MEKPLQRWNSRKKAWGNRTFSSQRPEHNPPPEGGFFFRKDVCVLWEAENSLNVREVL